MNPELTVPKNAFVGGSRGPIVVSIWDGVPTTPDGLAAVRLLATAARTERSLLVAAILAPGTKPPPTEVRDALAAELGRIGPKIAGLANAPNRQGLPNRLKCRFTRRLRHAHPHFSSDQAGTNRIDADGRELDRQGARQRLDGAFVCCPAGRHRAGLK